MFCDTNESESCLVKAPAMHASESVLVVSELLCTGVQANTERHTRNETREMCSCWGYKQHPLQDNGPVGVGGDTNVLSTMSARNHRTCQEHDCPTITGVVGQEGTRVKTHSEDSR